MVLTCKQYIPQIWPVELHFSSIGTNVVFGAFVGYCVVDSGGPGGWHPAQSVNVRTQINKLKNSSRIVISEWRLKMGIDTYIYRCFCVFVTTLILRNNKTMCQV
jgi:hypothetical protein